MCFLSLTNTRERLIEGWYGGLALYHLIHTWLVCKLPHDYWPAWTPTNPEVTPHKCFEWMFDGFYFIHIKSAVVGWLAHTPAGVLADETHWILCATPATIHCATFCSIEPNFYCPFFICWKYIFTNKFSLLKRTHTMWRLFFLFSPSSPTSWGLSVIEWNPEDDSSPHRDR